jgi:hypothetical protein
MNATQLAGTIAMAAATVACASRRDGRWWWLAAVFALMLAELQLNWRFVAHGWFEALLAAPGLPATNRRAFQALLLAAGLIGMGVLAARFVRGRQGLWLARLGAFVLVTVQLVELVSLHWTDRLLWQMVGPVMVIAWFWILAGALACAGALFGKR